MSRHGAAADELRRLGAAVPIRTADVVATTGPTADELALREGEEKLAGLRAHHATLDDRIEAAQRELALARAGDQGDPRAHLRHDQRPQPEEEHRYGRLVEFWSAISAGALLIFIVATLYLGVLGAGGRRRGRDRRVLGDRGGEPPPAHPDPAAHDLACWRSWARSCSSITYLPLIVVAGIAGIALLAIVDNVRELRG